MYVQPSNPQIQGILLGTSNLAKQDALRWLVEDLPLSPTTPSQMGLEDLAMFRAVPESVVLYPGDPVAAERLVAEAAAHEGIVYIRTSRPKTPVIYSNDEQFPIGGCKVLRESASDQITIIAAGVTVHEALKACDQLKAEGISVRVIDLYSVKPVDTETLLRAAAATNNTLITVEDHYPEGGLGEAVLGVVASQGVKVHHLAVNGIPQSVKADELMEKFGISAKCIVSKVKAIV